MMVQPKAPPLTGAEENRRYLRVFIQTYRNLPVLWDTSLRDYTNRDKRAEAYEQLVPIYRYLKRDATIEDVKKKINTLRTNYRKELKVVESARRAGHQHHPRCWTFLELDFLRNTEKFLAVNPNVRSEQFPFSENSQSQASFVDTNSAYNFKAILSQASPMHHASPPSITEMFQKSFGNPQQTAQQNSTPFAQHTTHVPTTPLQHPQSTSTPNADCGRTSAEQQPHHDDLMNSMAIIKRQRLSPTTVNGHNSEDLLNIARDYLSASYPEEETIARTWALKLKRLHREQRLLAEKLINDVLFEAELGTLHRGSLQINAFEPYERYDERSLEQRIKSPSPNRAHTSSTTITTTMEATEQKETNLPTLTPSVTTTTTPATQIPSPNSGNDSNFNSYS